MSTEARIALSRLVAALEHHFDMANNADVVSEAMLEDAELRLQDAFFTYDDVLFTALGIELPLELVEDLGDDDEEGDPDGGDEEELTDQVDDFLADIVGQD